MQLIPIDASVSFDCVNSDLIRFDWRNRTADFEIPEDEGHILRIRFPGQVIVRMLDELPLSIETDPATWHGLVPHHFAYRVEAGWEFGGEPEVWGGSLGLGPPTHYRFVTGFGCLDVLTHRDPEFSVIAVSG